MNVTEYRSIAELEPLVPDWRRLLQRGERASFFQTFEWMAAHWRHVGRDRGLRVLAFDEGGELCGMLPLGTRCNHTSVGRLCSLTTLGDGWPSFLGFVGEDVPRLFDAAMNYLNAHGRGFDQVALKAIRGGQIASLAEADQYPCRMPLGQSIVTADQPVALLELTGAWDSYWESRRAQQNRRRNVERCARRLAEQGQVRFERYRPGGSAAGDDDPRWHSFEACVELARRSWQANLTTGTTLCHDHVVDFLRDAHQVAVQQGALDLSLLYLDDDPIAFVYGYHWRGYVDLMRSGFDPRFATLAPGNVLWKHLIADSFARGDRWLDLGPTCLDYKRFWATAIEPQLSFQRYAWTAKGLLLRSAHALRRFRRRVDDSNQASKAEAAHNRAANQLAV